MKRDNPGVKRIFNRCFGTNASYGTLPSAKLASAKLY